ncbi:hypothetical protein Slin14017_G041890 [Septoria linicola]|nr:hypothetical protein Slin14017_G041890 [Septoria linicola]
MASSSSSAKPITPASNLSSPEIKVTDDHGNGTVLRLPDSMSEQMMVEQRARALTIEVAEAEKKIHLATRPAPMRSASSEAASEPVATLKPAPISNPAESPINGKSRGTELKRVGSGHGSLRMSLKSMTSTGLLSSKKKQSIESGRSSLVNSGTASPTRTDTPEVKTIFAKKTCPDLDAVSRALESLKVQAREPEDPLVLNLKSLEKKIQGAREDCAKLLTRAMQARDRQQYEMCRALCIQIVHNQHSKIETKVYAYNILSTQASPGQAMNFLNEAAKLVKQCDGPEKDKLSGIVAMLQEHALVKENNREAAKHNASTTQQVLDLGTFERAPTMPKSVKAPDGNILQLPKEDLPKGALTPKSEKIFNWAKPAEGGRGKTSVV